MASTSCGFPCAGTRCLRGRSSPASAAVRADSRSSPLPSRRSVRCRRRLRTGRWSEPAFHRAPPRRGASVLQPGGSLVAAGGVELLGVAVIGAESVRRAPGQCILGIVVADADDRDPEVVLLEAVEVT